LSEKRESGTAEVDAAAREGLRKASWRVIPLIALGYGTAYVDRVNISFASLQMNRDLHFSATVYGLGAGMFFLSYAACEIPSNLLLYKLGARRWLATILMAWGVIAMGMVFVRTPLEFYVARFLLGVAEAGFFPGAVFYMMQWYPAAMRARAITGFYVAYPLSTVVMGGLAGALLGLQGKMNLAGWQWLFLVEALPAVVLGGVFLRWLPDGPGDAKWLTEEERGAVLDAVGQDAQVGGHHESIGVAVRDKRVWLIGGFMACMLMTSYAYQFSAPAIIQRATGLSTSNVGFVIAAMGLVAAAAMVGNGMLSDRTGERHWNIIPECLAMAAGFLVCGTSSSAAAVMAGIVTIVVCLSAMQGPLLAIPPTFLSGRSQAAGIATMNMIGMGGAFIGPYWMGIAKDLTGDYQRGLLTMAAPMLAAAGIMLHLRRMAQTDAARLALKSALEGALETPNL
jgi:ACS family tartrate transporter-like MFS transporter